MYHISNILGHWKSEIFHDYYIYEKHLLMSDLKDRTIKYPNDELTVLWKPGLCIHSGICAAGLPKVFQPKAKPWVNMNSASSDEIIEQVSKCPSGALSILKE